MKKAPRLGGAFVFLECLFFCRSVQKTFAIFNPFGFNKVIDDFPSGKSPSKHQDFESLLLKSGGGWR